MCDRRLALVALVLLAAVVGLVVGLVSCKGDESAAPPTGSTVGTPENRAHDRFPLAEPLPDYFAGYDQKAIGRMEAQALVSSPSQRQGG